MQLDLDRRDIHMADYARPLSVEIDDRLLLSALLRGTLLPYVPAIAEGWTFRAVTDAGGIDIAATGGFNGSPRLLVDDTEIGQFLSEDTLRIGARPTTR
ncbi:hypothetical protein ACH3VR_19680 [Microbacterium sp. B2969]|uniref:Uncharacterized protein n=1 Tax=Microbacterium alkaliflavum TaxID=3248839 RepID=A0ABW7QCI8_9MICO